jgi:hypothetical protein
MAAMGIRAVDDHHYQLQAGTCARSSWSGRDDRCRRCDAEAAPGFVWCGNRCEDDYRANHWWDHARRRALVRDGNRCVHCGLGPDVLATAKLVTRALLHLGPVEAARLWATDEWRALALACEVEVNHVVPRVGAGYWSGCHHHLDGLETLCHRCHVAVTSDQRRLRATG